MRNLLRLSFLMGVLALPCAAAAAVTELRFANYNVENLYDAEVNQPVNALTGEPGDAEWCPQSWRRWTDARYRTKLSHLAWVVHRMRPDVLALEEVENRAVVKALADQLKRDYGWTFPHIAHRDSKDPRGIDVAILSRYPIRSVNYFPRLGRRGLLIAEIEVDGTRLTVFANHWKSQIGDAEQNVAVRTQEAVQVREEMLRRLRRDPDAVIVSLGDYNEDLDGPSFRQGLLSANDRKTALASTRRPLEEFRPYNLIGDIPPAERGSFYYARRKVWNTFDAILVPPRMLLPASEPGPAWRVGRPEETLTFHLPEMRWGDDGRPSAYRRARKYGPDGEVKDESYYTEGYSDHFPVLTVLHRAVAPAPAKDGAGKE